MGAAMATDANVENDATVPMAKAVARTMRYKVDPP
jgi:hypothetical protein